MTATENGNKGYVYIIGAGPGDPELLTVKAQRVLHEADVILYDDLVSLELVDQFRGQKIYTGKRKDSHHFEQEEINREIMRVLRLQVEGRGVCLTRLLVHIDLTRYNELNEFLRILQESRRLNQNLPHNFDKALPAVEFVLKHSE